MKKYLLTFATLFIVFSCSNEPGADSLSVELTQKRKEKFQLVQKYGLDVLFSSYFNSGNVRRHEKQGLFRVLLDIDHTSLNSPMIGPQPDNAIIGAQAVYVFSNRPFPISTLMSANNFSKLWGPETSFTKSPPNGHLTFFRGIPVRSKHVSVQIHDVHYIVGGAFLALDVSIITGSETLILDEDMHDVSLFVDTFVPPLTSPAHNSKQSEDPQLEVPKLSKQALDAVEQLKTQLSPTFKSSFQGSLQNLSTVLGKLSKVTEEKLKDSIAGVTTVLLAAEEGSGISDVKNKINESITSLYHQEICYYMENTLTPSDGIFTALNDEVGSIFDAYKDKQDPWRDFILAEETAWQKNDPNSVTIKVIEKIAKAIGVQVDGNCVANSDMKNEFRKTIYFDGFSYFSFYLLQEVVKAKAGCPSFLTQCIK